jgi:hypothetical protein
MRWTPLLILSCAAPPPDEPAPEPPAAEPEVVLDLRGGEAPRLWIEGRPIPGGADVELWGDGIGPILGIAATMAFDPPVAADASLEPDVVGADAVELLHVLAGEIALGVARRGAARGEHTLDRATLIARARIVTTTDVIIDVRRAIARRADGRHVPLAVYGAMYRVGGAR